MRASSIWTFWNFLLKFYYYNISRLAAFILVVLSKTRKNGTSSADTKYANDIHFNTLYMYLLKTDTSASDRYGIFIVTNFN